MAIALERLSLARVILFVVSGTIMVAFESLVLIEWLEEYHDPRIKADYC